MFTRLMMIAALGVSLAAAKTYTITLADSCKAGSTQLRAGEYKVKLDGNKVMLTDEKGNTVTPNAKLETESRKAEETEVVTSKASGTNRLESISLAGSKTKVVFE